MLNLYYYIVIAQKLNLVLINFLYANVKEFTIRLSNSIETDTIEIIYGVKVNGQGKIIEEDYLLEYFLGNYADLKLSK